MSSAVTSLRLRELFPLGNGGMGTAYLACSRAGQFERLVVVKRLHEHLMNDAQARQRLLEEAELAGYVHHSNVVGVQHVGRDDRGLFLVLDYVDGTSLRRLIQAVGSARIPEPVVLRIILDCLAGLSAIHMTTDNRKRPLHILHRDVTPENILLGLDGVARLTDFGIAKSARSSVQTGPLQLIGKLPFMAPEYIDHAELSPALDVYALGVSLWGLLAGRSPWEKLDETQLLVRILIEGVPPLPAELGVGEALCAVVAQACALDPKRRYSTAREMALALEALEAVHPIAKHAQVAEFFVETLGVEAASLREKASQYLDMASLAPGPLSSSSPASPSPSLRGLSLSPLSRSDARVGSSSPPPISSLPSLPALSSPFPALAALPSFPGVPRTFPSKDVPPPSLMATVRLSTSPLRRARALRRALVVGFCVLSMSFVGTWLGYSWLRTSASRAPGPSVRADGAPALAAPPSVPAVVTPPSRSEAHPPKVAALRRDEPSVERAPNGPLGVERLPVHESPNVVAARSGDVPVRRLVRPVSVPTDTSVRDRTPTNPSNEEFSNEAAHRPSVRPIDAASETTAEIVTRNPYRSGASTAR